MSDVQQKSSISIAVLETMWGWCGMERDRTKWFTINEQNFTGRRLYRMLGNRRLLVTNACPQTVSSAGEHGTPDPKWLSANIAELRDKFDVRLFMVCGRVAQSTWCDADIRLDRYERVIFMPHPAARGWTNEALARCAAVIQDPKDARDLKVTFDEVRELEMLQGEAT